MNEAYLRVLSGCWRGEGNLPWTNTARCNTHKSFLSLPQTHLSVFSQKLDKYASSCLSALFLAPPLAQPFSHENPIEPFSHSPMAFQEHLVPSVPCSGEHFHNSWNGAAGRPPGAAWLQSTPRTFPVTSPALRPIGGGGGDAGGGGAGRQ